MTKVKKSPKRGRPSRREASAKALRGVNLAEIDPAGILRAIAADASAPATARIAACRALLGQTPKKPAGDDEHDAVTALALRLLNGAKKK